MDADTARQLGGVCQIAGVLLVVWDLLALTRYRGDMAQVAVRLRGRWAVIRQRSRWPGPDRVIRAHGISGFEVGGHARARTLPGPFPTWPGQSVEDQVVELAEYVNRLLDAVMEESEERARAILEERQERQRELQAEAQRLDASVATLRQELHDLREVTTGGIRLRWEGVPLLVVGLVFTTWPDGVAHWLGWLPWRLLVVVAGFYVAARLSGVFSQR